MTDTVTDLDERLAALTELQRRFVLHCLDAGSATEAYRRAGGRATSDESAFSQACRLMRNDQVRAALAELKTERRRLMVADSIWIREQLVMTYLRCSQAVPVLDSEGKETGTFKSDYNAAISALRTLVALIAADPPPKYDQEAYEATKARLKMLGVNRDPPYPEELDLMSRLGINGHQARVLCDAEKMKQQLRARGIDADTPVPTANPGGST
jgi:hypothetical protein